MALLRLVVVDPDFWPELDLLDVDRNLVLARKLGLLLLLVAVFAVVHDPRDRRIGLRRDLDEVEILPVRVVERFLDRLHPELAALLVDETDLRDTDVLVDPAVWNRRPSRLNATSWPQRRFTKLLAPPSRNDKTAARQRLDPFQPPGLNLRQAGPRR